MEFTVVCPTDGRVEVTFEDISTVILRDPELVDVVFDCPTCGAPITVSIRLPNLLMSAIESLEDAAETGRPVAGFMVVAASEDDGPPAVAEEDEDRIDAYCEYFRRQLSAVGCVQDALEFMDEDD